MKSPWSKNTGKGSREVLVARAATEAWAVRAAREVRAVRVVTEVRVVWASMEVSPLPGARQSTEEDEQQVTAPWP